MVRNVLQFSGVTSEPPPAPDFLGPAGRALWSRVAAEYTLSSVGELVLLELACRGMDRAEFLRADVEKRGAVVSDRQNPSVAGELKAYSYVANLLCKMGLHVEPLKSVGRPGKFAAWDGRT
jgi:hypothetical protein